MALPLYTILLLPLLLLLATPAHGSTPPSPPPSVPSDYAFTLAAEPSRDLSPLVLNLTHSWLALVGGSPNNSSAVPVTITVGGSAGARSIISDAALAATGSEGFIIRASCSNLTDAITVAVRGNPRVGGRDGAPWLGNHFAAYHLLQRLGVHFLHPLAPTVTPAQRLDRAALCALDTSSAPHWPRRIWHYHTMHPLELADLFNGFDHTPPPPSPAATKAAAAAATPVTSTPAASAATPSSPSSSSASSTVTSSATSSSPPSTPWASMLPEAQRFFEWLIANKQNGLEWVALGSSNWPKGFVDGALRKQRMRTLVDLAHSFGVDVGVDVPIALEQQHSWAMIGGNVSTSSKAAALPAQLRAIERRLDWLFNATSGAGKRGEMGRHGQTGEGR